MPASLYIDQDQTFKAVTFLGSAPRIAFGTSDTQDLTKDGTPKWDIQVAVTYEQFGRLEHEVLKIGMISPTNPGETLTHPQPVQLTGLRVRIHPIEKRLDKNGTERYTGGTATYQADALHPTTT